jgi:hypothetical protein
MNLIRRSVSFPEDIYEALRLEAFSERTSFNKILIDKIDKKIKRNSGRKTNLDFALFDKIASTSVKYDATKAVREERDRNDI